MSGQNPSNLSRTFPIGKSLSGDISQGVSLYTLYELIKNPLYENLTRRARNIRKQSLKEYQLFKQAHAPFFMPHASLEPGDKKRLSNCKHHTGFLAIEYDKLSADQLAAAKQAVKKVPWVALSYTSLSGRGICALVYYPDVDTDNHDLYYPHLARALDGILGIRHDPSGSNLNRLRFFAHDPNVYLNPEPLPCPIPIKTKAPKEDLDLPSISLSNNSREYQLIISMHGLLHAEKKPYFLHYKSWMQGAYALFNSFKTPLAAELYHLLASLSNGYNFEEVEKKLIPIKASISQNENRPVRKLGFGSLIHLFKAAISGTQIRLRDLYELKPKSTDYRDTCRKELSAYCPGLAHKVKTRRARIIRYIHRRVGLGPLPPKLSKVETLACFFEVSPSVMSQDLSALHHAGLISLSFIDKHSLNRSRSIALTDKALDILCMARMPSAQAFEKETQNPDFKPTSPSSDFSPLYINFPLDPENSSSSSKKINKKEEIPAVNKPQKRIESQKIHIPPDQLPEIRKAWEHFCLSLSRMPGKNTTGKASAQLFAQIALKYPGKIASISEQIINKPPSKTPYFWLKDESFSLEAYSPFLNASLGKADLELFARMKIPPADRMVFIARKEVSFPVLSLQGARKHPLSLPNGIVYCTSIHGPLFLNRDGRKRRLRRE